MCQQTPALANLAPRQDILAPLERIGPRLEHELHRRTLEAQRIPEAPCEVAAVVLGQGSGLIAVNHDNGRILPALMGIAQLDAPTPHRRRGMVPDHALPTPLPCKADMKCSGA